MPPASLYVHVPFCARRCPYCDFAVSVNGRADFRAAYVEALQLEIKSQLEGTNAQLETIFCGGGTPTELSAAQLNLILDTVRSHATLAPNAEVSLEANPENLSRETLRQLREGGWNRLSLGAQSFDNETLRFLGRAHDSDRIGQVVQDARAEGWTNISLDLIFGAPSQTLE
ncbi:radical SAM protein, partial [bacterium]